MKQKVVKILMAIIFVAITGVLLYSYTFNRKHRNIADEKATVSVPAKEMYTHFKNDESSATAKYLDKVIEIQGQITSVEASVIVLNNQIQVSFNAKVMPSPKNGNFLTIKGRCVGYDELLEMVKIDQAVTVKK